MGSPFLKISTLSLSLSLSLPRLSFLTERHAADEQGRHEYALNHLDLLSLSFF